MARVGGLLAFSEAALDERAVEIRLATRGPITYTLGIPCHITEKLFCTMFNLKHSLTF